MQNAMTLEQLLTEVKRHQEVKQDKVASTKQNIRMVPGLNGEQEANYIVLLKEGSSELERYGITETAHQQIAYKLGIPTKYYFRLLVDHPDLVRDQVNALFEREPSMRLIRILDGKVRAFLSDRYYRLDNDMILEQSLPQIVKGDIKTTMLASNVSDDYMHLKCLFTDDKFAHNITTARGEDRIMRPGFRMTNSETGRGSFKVEAFFFDSYCLNGCVFGTKDAFSLSRTHLGGKLIEGQDFEIISRDTQKAEEDLIGKQVRDMIAAIANPDNVQKMADRLRETANTPLVTKPVAAVELAVKNLALREVEKDGILETFLRDQDYTQYGLAAAVTEQANDSKKASFTRACELEDIGAKILSMSLKEWTREYVHVEAA